jgi:hypothetical protein
MSIIETLTEGIVNRDMKKEGSALLSKWGKTGLLEGLQTEHQKSTMARLLENQAKELLRESSSMSAGDVEGFAAVAFPIVRRVFAGLIANELVSVQPMSLPSGLIFFLDFSFGDSQGGRDADSPRMGNVADGTDSIYGTDKLGSQVIDGVSLLADSTYKTDNSGPRGKMGYAYSSPSGSNAVRIQSHASAGNTLAHFFVKSIFKLDGSVTDANKKLIQYDPDLLASTDSTVGIVVVDFEEEHMAPTEGVGALDFENMGAFQLSDTNLTDIQAAVDGITGGTAGTNIFQIRRLTERVSAAEAATTTKAVRYVISAAASLLDPTDLTMTAQSGIFEIGELTFPVSDHIPAAGTVGAVQSASTLYALEGSAEIPEIDIKVDSTAITAQTKKLKAKWTPELGQDLNAYHNLDAEVELTSILSEQIALEIDREILADLVKGATASTQYWSRSPGLFVNKVTGAEIGANSAAPDFTGTVSEWYETLIETINDVSAQIHRKTLRGGANFVIVSPEVANILEFTSGFRANVTADADKGDIGAVNTGSLSRKFDVIVDPYFPRNVILVGRKGSSFLESGYVYAPYVPLQTTPTIFGPEDFVPRKGVMTRYAKKMVRPDMYGLVIVRDLLGGEYSS